MLATIKPQLKKSILYLLFVINILFIPMEITLKAMKLIVNPEMNFLLWNILLFLLALMVVFWIYLLLTWKKYDKSTSRLLLLIIFNGLYTWFYFLFSIKNGWIFKTKNSLL
jgi:hypothetical protein